MNLRRIYLCWMAKESLACFIMAINGAMIGAAFCIAIAGHNYLSPKYFAPVIHAPAAPAIGKVEYNHNEANIEGHISHSIQQGPITPADEPIKIDEKGRMTFGKVPWTISNVVIDPHERAVYSACLPRYETLSKINKEREATKDLWSPKDTGSGRTIYGGVISVVNNNEPWSWSYLHFDGPHHLLSGICK